MKTKSKKGIVPPRYDAEFKAGAVKLVTEEGRSSAEVAKDLGICKETLRSWVKASTGMSTAVWYGGYACKHHEPGNNPAGLSENGM